MSPGRPPDRLIDDGRAVLGITLRTGSGGICTWILTNAPALTQPFGLGIVVRNFVPCDFGVDRIIDVIELGNDLAVADGVGEDDLQVWPTSSFSASCR